MESAAVCIDRQQIWHRSVCTDLKDMDLDLFGNSFADKNGTLVLVKLWGSTLIFRCRYKLDTMVLLTGSNIHVISLCMRS